MSFIFVESTDDVVLQLHIVFHYSNNLNLIVLLYLVIFSLKTVKSLCMHFYVSTSINLLLVNVYTCGIDNCIIKTKLNITIKTDLLSFLEDFNSHI